MGQVAGILVQRKELTEILQARTILVAAGTKPNNILAQEDHDFKLDGLYFRAMKANGEKIILEIACKKNFITYRNKDDKSVSFFGDMHPAYAGNVVKAMASAKDGYPIISQELTKLPRNLINKNEFVAQLEQKLTATIQEINRLAPNIIEIIIKAPLASQNFKPGQFYRLQNFAHQAQIINNKKLIIENIALTGATTDPEAGTISLITLEMGGSSNLCKYLTIGERGGFNGSNWHSN